MFDFGEIPEIKEDNIHYYFKDIVINNVVSQNKKHNIIEIKLGCGKKIVAITHENIEEYKVTKTEDPQGKFYALTIENNKQNILYYKKLSYNFDAEVYRKRLANQLVVIIKLLEENEYF